MFTDTTAAPLSQPTAAALGSMSSDTDTLHPVLELVTTLADSDLRWFTEPRQAWYSLTRSPFTRLPRGRVRPRERRSRAVFAAATLRLQVADIIQVTEHRPLLDDGTERQPTAEWDYSLTDAARLRLLLAHHAVPTVRRQCGHHMLANQRVEPMLQLLRENVDLAASFPEEALAAAILCAAPRLRASIAQSAARDLSAQYRMSSNPAVAAVALAVLTQLDLPRDHADLEHITVMLRALMPPT